MSPPSFPPSLTSVQRSSRTNGNKVDASWRAGGRCLSAVPLTTARARADDKSKMGPWRLDSGNTATGKIWKRPRPGNLGDGASGQEKKRVVQSNGLISASSQTILQDCILLQRQRAKSETERDYRTLGAAGCLIAVSTEPGPGEGVKEHGDPEPRTRLLCLLMYNCVRIGRTF